jgi:hypothetical protein
MSLKMEARVLDLEAGFKAQAFEIKELRALIQSFVEPELHVVVPPFPAILKRMGYMNPNDGSLSVRNG